jgi:hypothetical protein
VKAVAALYIDPKGPYPSMAGVDAWDAQRDATKYYGPNPVVAHPPCAPWSGSLSGLCDRRSESALAVRAVQQVRAYGGVLEHPAHSRLFGALELPTPKAMHRIREPSGRWLDADVADEYGGFTIEVQQVDFGHPCRKKTWLYLCGVPREAIMLPATHREPTHWCSGGHRAKRPPPPGIKIASAKMRRVTPPAFAEWLVHLARSASGCFLTAGGAA